MLILLVLFLLLQLTVDNLSYSVQWINDDLQDVEKEVYKISVGHTESKVFNHFNLREGTQYFINEKHFFYQNIMFTIIS